jgi:hypothetical protein
MHMRAGFRLKRGRIWPQIAADFESMSTILRKRKSRKKPGLLDQAIEIHQLPPLVMRQIAVRFSGLSERTLMRAEKGNPEKGIPPQLHPVKRNSQCVSYFRDELLEFLGLKPKTSLAEQYGSRRPRRKAVASR